MAKKTLQDEVKPYGLHHMVEIAAAKLSMSRPTFWGRVGSEIDPERIVDKASSLVLRACKSIAADGRTPSVPAAVMGRLQLWFEQGKIDADELALVNDLGEDAALAANDLAEDAIVDSIAPYLKRELTRAALDAGMQAFGKRSDTASMEKLLSRANRIGVYDRSLGMRFTPNVVSTVVDAARIELFATGIPELDYSLGGGIKRGSFTIVTGSTGVGKSFFVDHYVAHAITNGLNAAIATLELAEHDHYARILSNLVGIEYIDIQRYPAQQAEAKARLDMLQQRGKLGFCTCKFFDSVGTPFSHIAQWLDEEEQNSGQKIDVLAIDYLQMLDCEGSHDKRARHEVMAKISKDALMFSRKRDIWLISPNQANAEGMDARKTKILKNHHSAESKGIPKSCDLHITINPQEGGMNVLHVAKNRYGPSGQTTGPIPHMFELGRFSPVERPDWPF